MKKIILFVILIASLQSCVNILPLKGKYQEGAVKTKINEPFEKAWEKAIDMIANTGLTVKMIDKSSGLIISERSGFSYLEVTAEDKKGKVMDPRAYIVRERDKVDSKPLPFSATAIWNLRIKEVDKGTSIISVILHNIGVSSITSSTYKGIAIEKYQLK